MPSGTAPALVAAPMTGTILMVVPSGTGADVIVPTMVLTRGPSSPVAFKSLVLPCSFLLASPVRGKSPRRKHDQRRRGTATIAGLVNTQLDDPQRDLRKCCSGHNFWADRGDWPRHRQPPPP